MAESISAPTLTTGNVGVAVSGSVNLAPLGTTLPTATTGSLNAAFVGLGYLTDDGLEENFDVTRQQITMWQNAATARETVTDAKMFYTGTIAETTVAATEAFYGTTVTQAAGHGSYTVDPGASSGAQALVVTVLDGSEIKVITCSRAEVFKGGNVVYKNDEPIGYPVEIVCYEPPVVYDTRLKTPA